MKADDPSVGQSGDEVTKSELLHRIRDLDTRVEKLEQENDVLRKKLEKEQEAREGVIKNEQMHRTRIVQNAKDEVNRELKDCHESLVEEQKTRSPSDSKIVKRLTALEDEIGLDTNAAHGVGDKLERLVRNGASDVSDRVYPVHERAQAK